MTGPTTSGGSGRRIALIGIAAWLGLPLAVAAQNAPAPGHPPEPSFDNPNTDPRDFEGLWWPRHVIQSLSPITPDTPPSPTKPEELISQGLLSGPIVGSAATNEQLGSTLQCTPVWRLIGAGGGMSNYWIMGEKEIVLLSEEDQDVARKIYLNVDHPKDLVPQPNGHSVGHWENNTLVIDTVGFSNPDGSLADRHVTERITKTGGQMMDHAIVQERGRIIYVDLPSKWRPDFSFSENVCEEGFRRYELRDGKVINLNTQPKE
jgi:hypothetical protein